MKWIMPLLVISMLILVGCTSGGGNAPVESPYSGGWKGVIANFEEMGVVSDVGGVNEVYENEQFPVDVRIQNLGEMEMAANSITITLKGVDHSVFGLSSNSIKNSDVIEKVSEFLPEGGEELLSFGNAKYDITTGNFYDAHFYATLEYPYKTFVAVPDVCYKEDLKDNSICIVDEAKTAFSSGAPITVSSVAERPAGRGKFYIEYRVNNVGGGKVKANAADEFGSTYGEVKFAMKTDPANWECVSRGSTDTVRLTDGEGVIRCKYPKTGEMASGTLYTKQVDLELSYVYQSTIDTVVRVLENLE